MVSPSDTVEQVEAKLEVCMGNMDTPETYPSKDMRLVCGEKVLVPGSTLDEYAGSEHSNHDGKGQGGDGFGECDGPYEFLPPWTLTGSWSFATADADVSCTEPWAPQEPTCDVHRQYFSVPGRLDGPGAEFSISGSSNVATTGKLSIVSGRAYGWSEITFSSPSPSTLRPSAVAVHACGAESGSLDGTYYGGIKGATRGRRHTSLAQARASADKPAYFVVSNPLLTAALDTDDTVEWCVTIAVPDGNVEDINAHFTMVSYAPPPSLPPSPSPSAPPAKPPPSPSPFAPSPSSPPPSPSPSSPPLPPPSPSPLTPPPPPDVSINVDISESGLDDVCPRAVMGALIVLPIPAIAQCQIDDIKTRLATAIKAKCSGNGPEVSEERLFTAVDKGNDALLDHSDCSDFNIAPDDTLRLLAPWPLTGSWGMGPSQHDECTENEGPADCQTALPPTDQPGGHPLQVSSTTNPQFSISGSTNYDGTGQLLILSGRDSGWSSIQFSGAAVENCEVGPGWVLDPSADPTADENMLSGSWDKKTQVWTVDPDDVDDTSAAKPMFTPIPWAIKITLVDPENIDSVNAHFVVLKFNPPPPAPPLPNPPPPPPVVSVHGDPMFKSHGTGTHFWLAAGRISPLLLWRSPEGASMRLSGKTFHSSDAKNQWFDQFTVTQDGVTVLDVAVKAGNVVDARQLGNTVDIKVDGKPIDKRGASPKASLLIQGAKHAFKAHLSKRSDGVSDNVETTAGGLALSIYSSKADKFDTPKMAKKYMHLNIKFAGGLPKDASGIFTELAGNKPVSLATKALLKAPPGKAGKKPVWKPPMES